MVGDDGERPPAGPQVIDQEARACRCASNRRCVHGQAGDGVGGRMGGVAHALLRRRVDTGPADGIDQLHAAGRGDPFGQGLGQPRSRPRRHPRDPGRADRPAPPLEHGEEAGDGFLQRLLDRRIGRIGAAAQQDLDDVAPTRVGATGERPALLRLEALDPSLAVRQPGGPHATRFDDHVAAAEERQRTCHGVGIGGEGGRGQRRVTPLAAAAPPRGVVADRRIIQVVQQQPHLRLTILDLTAEQEYLLLTAVKVVLVLVTR